VRHTYGYYEHNYGLVNEVGLALSESSVSSRTVGWSKAFSYGYNAFDINELSKVALERCATARCAIRTMGSLAEGQAPIPFELVSIKTDQPRFPNFSSIKLLQY
jgi:dipeptidase